MKTFNLSTALAVTMLVALVGNTVGGDDNRSRMKAGLNGSQEVPTVFTMGSGVFQAKLDEAKTSIAFELSYEKLAGTASAAHIFFGQPGANGAGPMITLCGGSKPACPASLPVTGTIAAADILAIPDQGIAAGNFDAALKAIRSGNAYVNVQSSIFPKGEIRGQIRGRHFGHFDDGDDD